MDSPLHHGRFGLDYDPISGEYRGHAHGPECGMFHVRRDWSVESETKRVTEAHEAA